MDGQIILLILECMYNIDAMLHKGIIRPAVVIGELGAVDVATASYILSNPWMVVCINELLGSQPFQVTKIPICINRDSVKNKEKRLISKIKICLFTCKLKLIFTCEQG